MIEINDLSTIMTIKEKDNRRYIVTQDGYEFKVIVIGKKLYYKYEGDYLPLEEFIINYIKL